MSDIAALQQLITPGISAAESMPAIGKQAIANQQIQQARDAAKDASLSKNADPLEATQSGVIPSLPGYTPSAILGNNGNSPSTLGWPKSSAPGVDAIAAASPNIGGASGPPIPTIATQAPTKTDASQAPMIGQTSSPDHTPNAPETSPTSQGGFNLKSVLPTLLGLVQGGLDAGSAYYQKRGGDEGPTAQQVRLQREQQYKMQQNDLANKLQLQSVQYQQQRDMAGLENEYAIKLNQAQTSQQKQLIQSEYQQRAQLLRAQQQIQLENFQRLLGGQSVGSAVGTGAPTLDQTMSLWGAAKPGGSM